MKLSPYASFLQRTLARFIDIVFITVPLTAFTILALVYLRSLPLAIAFITLEAIYKPFMEGRFGFTIGKKLVKIRVVDQLSGKLMNLNQNLTRFLPWAIIYFTTLFVYTRYYQAPGFEEVLTVEGFIEYIKTHALSDNFFVSMLNNMTIFSVVWMFSDPFRRALHDRLAGTVVINDPEVISQMKNPL